MNGVTKTAKRVIQYAFHLPRRHFIENLIDLNIHEESVPCGIYELAMLPGLDVSNLNRSFSSLSLFLLGVDCVNLPSRMNSSLVELEKAVARLEEALEQPLNDFIRDSIIQRFEFCMELAWKSGKRVLGLTATAPKVVIRDLAQQGVIADPALWFSFIDARNETSHTYKEEVAKKVYGVARSALPHLKALVEKLKAI